MFSIGGHSHLVNHGGAGHVTGLHRGLFGPTPGSCALRPHPQWEPITPMVPSGTQRVPRRHHGGVWLTPGVGSETQLPILLKLKARFITHRLRHE